MHSQLELGSLYERFQFVVCLTGTELQLRANVAKEVKEGYGHAGR